MTGPMMRSVPPLWAALIAEGGGPMAAARPLCGPGS
jgi:hypothetical protein